MPYKDKGLSADFQRSWEYVTIPQRFYTARWKFTFETGVYSIALVAFNVVPVGEQGQRGGTGKNDVMHFRGSSLAELREAIEKTYPSAVFSQSNPEGDAIKDVYAAQVKAQKVAAQKEKDEYNFVQQVTMAHRQLASEMTAEQLAEATPINLQSFINESIWHDWFREHREGNVNFLDFPNKEGRNRATLLAICNHRGQTLPLHGELDAAIRYGLANNHFYLRNTYKRSQVDEYNAVVPYTGDVANARVSTLSDDVIHEARQRLRKALPAGQVPSQERIEATAKELGFSQELLNAVLGKTGSLKEANDARGQVRGDCGDGIPKPDANMSSAELKRGLQTLRPMVDPRDRRKGY